MDIRALRQVGKTGLELSPLGFGGGPFGNLFKPLAESDARAALETAWARGIRYYDTSPYYGFGLSEHRIGDGLRGRPFEEWRLSTKVGRLLRPRSGAPVPPERLSAAPDPMHGNFPGSLHFTFDFDYSYDGIMRSIEASYQRLGLSRIDVLFLHDLDPWAHGDRAEERQKIALTDGYRALEELRRNGQVSAFGLGVGSSELCMRALEQGDYDCFLLAGQYTLLDQTALDRLLPECEKRGASLIIGSPYHSGILASGAVMGARHNYRVADAEGLARVMQYELVAREYKVPLGALALQFPLAHPAVTAVIPGMRSAAEVTQAADFFATEIPENLWRDLKSAKLIREDAPTP